jgi:hypothetical protein
MGVSMLQFEAGQAGICGMIRGGDETGHDTLVIQLPHLPALTAESGQHPELGEQNGDRALRTHS